MRRDLSRFTDTTFDVLVIGGGIHGACVAWDACLRGLSVAVLDQGDFGAATSANSLGIVHGGLRYLARGDLPRMLESIRERSTLLRVAPRLVEPLPVLVPTYRGISRGRMAHRMALALNDVISWDRNKGLDPDRLIPQGRLVSPEESLRLFPGFSTDGLTGGAIWYDARLRHPERLTLSFLHSAARRGCVPGNYLRVDRLRVGNGAVQGAWVTDCVNGRELEVRSKTVVVAAGPWTRELTERNVPQRGRPASHGRALAVNVVIGRRLADVAVGVQAHSGPAEDPVCGGQRFLFVVPQIATTVLGTWYVLDEGGETRALRERGVRSLLSEFNEACPGVQLSPADVVRSQSGWLPLKGGLEPGRATALAERPRIVDHASRDGIRGLLSVEGVKYTTGRRVAEQVVDRVFTHLGRTSPPCQTGAVRLDESGGERYLEPNGRVVKADIMHAIHEEMALKLSDIVFRRSYLGALSEVSRTTLEYMSQVAGTELGWDAGRQEAEIEDVMRQFGIAGATVGAVG